jgi:hypothetical protein
MTLHWKYLDVAIQWNIWLFDIKLGVPGSSHWVIRIMINSPVTVTSQLMPLFVRKSTFTSRYIVHPTGGGAAKLVCESCGAEYHYVTDPPGCGFCAVMKESGITVCVAHRTRSWLWSDHGWCVRHNGNYVGTPNPGPVLGITVTRFKAKHKAYDVASDLEKKEWQKLSGLEQVPALVEQPLSKPVDFYRIVVEPYPLKPVQPLPDSRGMIGVRV